MYGCESWTIKKAECWRIDAFELWCWRTLLRVPWTSGRSNQFILKEISPEYSLVGLMLKRKLQFFGHLMRRADSFEKTMMLSFERLKAGGEGDDRRWNGWMASSTQWTWVWVNSGSWWWTEKPSVLWFSGSQGMRHDWVTELNLPLYVIIIYLYAWSLLWHTRLLSEGTMAYLCLSSRRLSLWWNTVVLGSYHQAGGCCFLVLNSRIR